MVLVFALATIATSIIAGLAVMTVVKGMVS